MQENYNNFMEEMFSLHQNMIGFNGLLQTVAATAMEDDGARGIADAVCGLGNYFNAILNQIDASITNARKAVSA